MRTDLVTAMLIYEWLTKYMPELAVSWQLEIDDQVRKMVEVVRSTVIGVHSVLVAQNLVARMAIEGWGLRDVVVLAGGSPTPLSPKPEQVCYWTDANPIVVAEATAAGYTAMHVDVMNAEHLKPLRGVTSGIASGLMHFLPDAAVPLPFNRLAGTGIEKFVFTQGNLGVGESLNATTEAYKKLGVNVFLRSPEQFQQLLPKNWRIEQVVSIREALQSLPLMDGHMESMPAWIDVYKVVRT
jgi:hypothetical protein